MSDNTKSNGRETKGALLGIHALTSLHPGSGTALGTVDLPVQRERHTQWPIIAGSALKGILRDACRERVKGDYQDDDGAEPGKNKRTRRDKANEDHPELVAAFGPATAQSSEHAGAVSVTDARLLAFPVRSLKGVFAWVSCPAVLDRLGRDAVLAGIQAPDALPRTVPDNHALVPAGCPCLIDDTQVVLEEFDFARSGADSSGLAEWVTEHLLPDTSEYAGTRERFRKQFLILSDNDFTHFVRHATEVSTRIGLNYETKTVKTGALFYQEFLPTETLFYAVVLANPTRTRSGNGSTGTELLNFVRECLPPVLQIGGDETIGKGLCRVRIACGKDA